MAMDRTAFSVGSNGRSVNISWGVLIMCAIQLVSWGTIWGAVTTKLDIANSRISQLESVHTTDQLALDSVKAQVAATHELAAKLDQEIMDFIAEYERDVDVRRTKNQIVH